MTRILLGVSTVITLATSCASWETTRLQVVDPLNELLHQRFPAAIQARDVEAFVSLYAPESAELADAEARAILAPWSAISRATCVIRHLDADGDQSAAATTDLRLDGFDALGEKRTLVETMSFRCERRADGWKIVDNTCTDSSKYASRGPVFVDEAASRGLHFAQKSCGVVDRLGIERTYLPGSGLAVGDIDGDGSDDVVLVGGRDLRLFVNRSGRFEDVSTEWGLTSLEAGEGRYAVIADIDGDGDRDVFVGVLDAPSMLCINEGGGYFRTIPADAAGIAASPETTGACFADFDGDGDVDLFVANGDNLLRKEPDPVYNAANGNPNQLFLNDGLGRFTDVSDQAGIADRGWALACTASDYDLDGDVDLFVANDFGQDRLFRNSGDATFEEVAEDAGIGYRGSSMGAAFGDCDGDGDIDLFVAGMSSNSAWILDQAGFPAPAPWPISFLFRGYVLDIMKEMFHGNRFYLNRGDGTFDEVSLATGTAKSGWAWGNVFLDYDNDGLLDMYVLNGLLSGELPDDC